MKTSTVSSPLTRFLGTVMILVGSSLLLNAQSDDKGLYDNTKGLELYPPGYSPRIPSNSIEVITTSDGYDNFDVGVNNAEQHISTNPNNPLQMIFGVNGSGTPWRHTEDAGLTWTISTPSGSNSGDPWSAYDSLGNVYVQWLSGSSNPVFRSTTNGATWGPGVTSAIGGDRNTMAVDQTSGPYSGYLYAGAWSPNCTFARSTNNGASFTVTLTKPNTTPGNMIAVGANVLGGQNVQGGCVYFVTITGGNPVPSTFTFFRSTNGGASFDSMSSLTVSGYVGTLNSASRLVINNARTRPYPMIAADNSNGPYRGRLYLVYASNEPAGNGNKPDIFIQYSTDQGATWTPRLQRINDNANPTTTNEWFPFIWCDKNTGRLYAKWYDMRNDPANLRAWVYATYSDDGGQTFMPNQKLSNTDMAYPGIPCSPNTNCYRGDYDGIVSAGDVSMAVWTDFRNLTYQNMLAYFPDFALLLSQNSLLLGLTDSATVRVRVPSVKLYTGVARFSATVSPAAPFTFTFLNGRDSLTSYPDSVSLSIRSNNAPAGTYTVTITGQGRNGTPVHRRTLTVTVSSANAVAVSTPNGGETWTYGSLNNIMWGRTGAVDSVRIEYSTDNGTSWATITPGVPASPASYAWTVPNTPTTQGRVRISWTDSASINDQSDAAFTIVAAPGWTAQTSGITNQFYSVKAVSPTVGWAAAVGGRVLRTTNGGTTWTSVGGGRIGTADVYNIAAVDANTAFITTTPTTTTYIFRTTNGGVLWDTVFQQAGGFIDAIHMYDAANGIALGDPVPAALWVVLRTTDGGTSWARIATEPVAVGGEAGTQNDLAVSGTSNIWFGSSVGGRVYQSTDAGSTWTSSTVPGATAATRVISVWFNNATYGIAGHYTTSGVYNAARTTDGGSTWSAITVGTATTYDIAVSGSGTDDFWMARGTNVYRSTDRGATWAQSYTGTGTFYDVDFRASGSTTYGWGVKDNGNIAFFFGSITGVEERPQPSGNVPQQIALLQNYPNPFNPSTTISYELPMQATVQLKIFNMLGQEITTLVDAPQPGGFHSIGWNGNSDQGHSVSSGMYVYRLEAKTGDGKTITSVKKMLLLK